MKENCCGCNACEQICTKSCISMVSDMEGFWYPKVNGNLCINCRLCEKVCPISHINTKQECIESYAAYSSIDEIRKSSSSGGIFTLLARQILEEGGIVFGVSLTSDFSEAAHIEITKFEDIRKIQGSKYLQSSTKDTFKKVKEYLIQNKKVLYSGVACQIAGLNNYLQKEYENLYTVDVLCHGVPSPKIWKKYLGEKQKEFNKKVDSIEFRNKDTGWKKYSVLIKFSENKLYTVPFNEDDYFKIFLSNIGLRPSCHYCKYKDLKRPSDISLGDYWGIENQLPEMDDDKGTSVVLLHSTKGLDLFEGIKKDLRYVSVDPNKALPITSDARHSVSIHPKRSVFFERLDCQSIKELVGLLRVPIYKRILRKIKIIGRIE